MDSLSPLPYLPGDRDDDGSSSTIVHYRRQLILR